MEFVQRVNALLQQGTSVKDLQEFSRTVLRAVTEFANPELSPPPRAAVLVPHPSGDLRVVFCHGETFEEADVNAVLERGKGVAGAAFASGQVVYMSDIAGRAVFVSFRDAGPPTLTEREGCFDASRPAVGYSSVLCLPIHGSGGPLGVLSVDAPQPVLGAGVELDLLERVRTFALILGLVYSRLYAEWLPRVGT